MKLGNKVVIAVGLTENSRELLKPLSEMDFLINSEIHFVHVFNTVRFSGLYSEFPIIYPMEPDYKIIEEAILPLLSKISDEVIPKRFTGKIVHKCLLGQNPKHVFRDYVNDNKADLVIIPTRAKHGFFDSSFAQYVNRHTQANMFLLKN